MVLPFRIVLRLEARAALVALVARDVAYTRGSTHASGDPTTESRERPHLEVNLRSP